MNELIRLLRSGPSWDYWVHDASVTESRLYPAELPPDLPVAIPLPTSSTLVGSAIPIGSEEPEVVLETSVDPEDFLAEYDRQLEAEGWELLRWLHHTSGFAPATESTLGAIYYDEASEHELAVQVIRRPAPPHSIYLTPRYEDDPGSSIGLDEHFAQMIPLLRAPPGSTMESKGGGGSRGQVDSSAMVRVDLGLEALHDHYARTLEGRGWQMDRRVNELPARISSDWTFSLDDDRYRSRLLVEATEDAQTYTATIESSVVRHSAATREDEALDMALLLLGEYRAGQQYAFLSDAARRELGIFEALTPEDVILAQQLLEGSEDEAAKREQLRTVGAERAYQLLQDVLPHPMATNIDSQSRFTPFVYQEVDGVSWLLQQVQAGLSVIEITTVSWTRWPPGVTWSDESWHEPRPIEPVMTELPTISDDVGTLYAVVSSTSKSSHPQQIMVDGREITIVHLEESLTARPGAPRNATSLTVRLNPAVRVLQPTEGDAPWPSRTVQFPEREFTFDLSARKEWLEYMQVPLPTMRGLEVQL